MKVLTAGALLFLSVLAATAQVTVDVILEQEQFLRSESLPVRIRISNFSGQALRLGDVPDWLTFNVENRDGRALPKKGDVPLPKPFSIESSKSVVLRADLMPSFEVADAGRYTLSVRLKLPQLEKEVITEPKTFDVIAGTTIWEHDFGVPGQSPPEARKYILQQATFLKQPRLYARVSDVSDTRVFKVVALGMIVSFAAPEAKLDRSSNLHVLFQNGAHTFLYAVITPDGEKIIQQTHEFAGSRPHLRAEDDGRVTIFGGKRRILLSDLPPPRVANTNDASERK